VAMGGGGLYPHYPTATSELEDQFSLNSVQALSYWRTQAAVQIWCNADAGEELPESKLI
jgi:heme-degrading monooxygenase HmoA